MKRILFFAFMVLICTSVSAQSVTMTFTGQDTSNHYIQLSRVVVTNLTQNWQDTLYWPDTMLTLTVTGIQDLETQSASLRLSQNNPNPFDGTTYANLTMADAGDVTMEIVDITGRVITMYHGTFVHPGIHQLRISLSTVGVYFLTARQNGKTASVKMVNQGNGGTDKIAIFDNAGTQLFSSESSKSPNYPKLISDKPFVLGDQMEYVGYALIGFTELESEHITQIQQASEDMVLSFAIDPGVFEGQPCYSTPTVTDIENNVYNTVWLGSQCWMAENLRTKHFSDGTVIPIGTAPIGGVDLSYCYYYPDSNVNNMLTYGLLYNWPTVMHGAASTNANPSGIQGICPDGWHVPSNAEFDQLSYHLKTHQYSCGGVSAKTGKAVASTFGWIVYPAVLSDTCNVAFDMTTNNASGFSAPPAGYYFQRNSSTDNGHGDFGIAAHFWSTTEIDAENASLYLIRGEEPDFHDGPSAMCSCYSVRCIRNE